MQWVCGRPVRLWGGVPMQQAVPMFGGEEADTVRKQAKCCWLCCLCWVFAELLLLCVLMCAPSVAGLAQEQVDAMAPALSALQGISNINSRTSPAAGASPPEAAAAASAAGTEARRGGVASTGAAERPAAAAAPSRSSLLQHTPKSSFKVTEGADGSSTAAPAPTAAASVAPAPGSLSGASPGQLQHAVTAALQELSSSSDAEFVSKALALSKMAAAGGFSTSSAELPNHSALIAAGGKSGKLHSLSELPASSALLAAGRRSSGKLASITLEGADLFELAAGAGQRNSSQHDLPAGSAALESLEELAAAMNGILADRQ